MEWSSVQWTKQLVRIAERLRDIESDDPAAVEMYYRRQLARTAGLLSLHWQSRRLILRACRNAGTLKVVQGRMMIGARDDSRVPISRQKRRMTRRPRTPSGSQPRGLLILPSPESLRKAQQTVALGGRIWVPG